MTTEDISLIQFASLQSLSTLNEAIGKLCEHIAILEDEKEEYRRKWLQEIQSSNELMYKQP